jgi:hypothetical protein
MHVSMQIGYAVRPLRTLPGENMLVHEPLSWMSDLGDVATSSRCVSLLFMSNLAAMNY